VDVQRNRGFTLLEALIVLAVASILACVAVPALRNASAEAHAAAAKAAFVETWLAAVNHAALTGAEVVVCPGSTAGCTDGIDWSQGWIAYADLDGDRLRDPTETMLRTSGALGGGVRLHSTAGRTRLVFQPNGGNAGSNVTFTLCDGRGPTAATTLVMSNGGRLRQGTPTAEAASSCVYAP
jgi:type IV fimbrial biogenesis protein FimT